ncbi:hypothetical protein CGZ97_07840, partial [Enemella evansiae]
SGAGVRSVRWVRLGAGVASRAGAVVTGAGAGVWAGVGAAVGLGVGDGDWVSTGRLAPLTASGPWCLGTRISASTPRAMA